MLKILVVIEVNSSNKTFAFNVYESPRDAMMKNKLGMQNYAS